VWTADEECVISGWDASFTTDASLLPHDNSMSEAELLHGFFCFYSEFDFPAHVISLRLGRAVDVASFVDGQWNDSKLQCFKVSLFQERSTACRRISMKPEYTHVFGEQSLCSLF